MAYLCAPHLEIMTNYLKRLGDKWGQKSVIDVLVVLLVFSLTGFSVLFLKKPIESWLIGAKNENGIWFSVLYYIAIFPVYNVLLLCWGAVFGKFTFFWEFEKRFFKRIFKRRQQ